MNVMITNWVTLVDDHGGEKAKELLKKLSEESAKAKTEEDLINLSVDFDTEKTEAIVLFTLVRRTKDFPSKRQTLRYEYRGTAN